MTALSICVILLLLLLLLLLPFAAFTLRCFEVNKVDAGTQAVVAISSPLSVQHSGRCL